MFASSSTPAQSGWPVGDSNDGYYSQNQRGPPAPAPVYYPVRAQAPPNFPVNPPVNPYHNQNQPVYNPRMTSVPAPPSMGPSLDARTARGFQGNLPASNETDLRSNPSRPPVTDVNSRILFHSYIFDYLQKQGFTATAHALLRDAPDTPVRLLPGQVHPGKGKGRADEKLSPTNSPNGSDNLSPHDRPQSSGAGDSVGSVGSSTSHFGFASNKPDFDSPYHSPAFKADTLPASSVMVESPQGFLLEWWTVFWESFRARAGNGGNVSARVFAEASSQAVEAALLAERSLLSKPQSHLLPSSQSQQFAGTTNPPQNPAQLREMQLAQAQHAAARTHVQNTAAQYGQIPLNSAPAGTTPVNLMQRQSMMNRRGGLAPVPPPSLPNSGQLSNQAHANHFLRQQQEQQLQLQHQKQQDLQFSQSINQQQSAYHSLYANPPAQGPSVPAQPGNRGTSDYDSAYHAQASAQAMRNQLDPAALQATRYHALALVEQQQLHIQAAGISRSPRPPSPVLSRGPSRNAMRDGVVPNGSQPNNGVPVVSGGPGMSGNGGLAMNLPPNRRFNGSGNGSSNAYYEPPTPQPEQYHGSANDGKYSMAAYRAQLGANQNGALSAISNQASPEQDTYSPNGPRSSLGSNSTPLLHNGQLHSPGTLGSTLVETKNFANSIGLQSRPPSTGAYQRTQQERLMLPPNAGSSTVPKKSFGTKSESGTPQASTPVNLVDSPQTPGSVKRKREGKEAVPKKRSNTLDRARPDLAATSKSGLPALSGSPIITVGNRSPHSITPPLIPLDRNGTSNGLELTSTIGGRETVQMSNKELEEMLALVGADPIPSNPDSNFFDLDLYCNFNANDLSNFNPNSLQ